MFWTTIPHIINKHMNKELWKAYSRERYTAFDTVQRNTMLWRNVTTSPINLLDLHAVSAACGSEMHCSMDGIHRRSKVYMATVQVFLNLVKTKMDSGELRTIRGCDFCA
jgi:hypothetical protein